jgi:uncharacterized protein (TIGR02996 family)
MPFKEEHPFLEAIYSRFHDDGPRFIYADFLDDAGDPDRADLVRVQVALARMAEDHPRRQELIASQGELLGLHKNRWCEHLRDLVSPSECEFRRGVLDSIGMNASEFLSKGAELLERIPVRRIRLREVGRVMAELVGSKELSKILELDLCGNDLGNGGLNLLLRSEAFKHLEMLDLGFTGIDDVGMRSLARAHSLSSLTSLSLNMNEQISSAGLIEFAHSPFFTGLTTLDISGDDIDESGLQAVLDSKWLASLHTLRLSENHLGDAGVKALTRSELLGRMLARSPRLDLRSNEIGEEGARALASCPLLTRCLALDLTNNSLADGGLTHLLRSQYLHNLKVLKVARNQITDAAIVLIRDDLPRLFAHLRVLDLAENRLTGHGIRILEAAASTSTVTLHVEQNNLAAVRTDSTVSVDLQYGPSTRVSEETVAAELRRRVAHPSLRAADPSNRPG